MMKANDTVIYLIGTLVFLGIFSFIMDAILSPSGDD